MIVMRSDLGKGGVILSVLIHFQIYILLFIMQWCSWHVRILSRKILEMKEASQGTYNSVELITESNQPLEQKLAVKHNGVLAEDTAPMIQINDTIRVNNDKVSGDIEKK